MVINNKSTTNSSSSSGGEKQRDDHYRCVQCGSPIQTLYIQYSPGNIRLIKCANCKAVADEYIECEIMILIIDLILHKAKAYRHLFFNMFSTDTFNFKGLLWKLALAYLSLDAYRIMVLTTSEKERISPGTFGSSAWTFGKVLMDVFFANLAFLCALFTGGRKLLKMSMGLGYIDMLLAILVSSYFKVFLVAMMVWEFPSSVVFIVDIFVLSSNTVALKVITDSTIVRCSGVSLFANALKFLTWPWVMEYNSKQQMQKTGNGVTV